MRKKWFSLGCLSSFLLLVLFMFVSTYSMVKLMKKKKSKPILPNSTLYLNLKGAIPEYSIIKENFWGKQKLSVHSIKKAIATAAKDEHISNILIESKFVATGYTNLNEIIEALDEFKKSGKPVYAYMDMGSTKDYFLASAADKIFLNPSASAGIMLTGVGINTLFYKQLFDRIGVEVNVIHAGKYKGAGENYYRSKFSEPVKKNLTLLLDNIYNQMITDVAKRRKLKVEDVKKIFENRDKIFINKEMAVKTNLVDALNFRKDIFDQFGITKKSLISASKYIPGKLLKTSPNKIAVVYAEGVIKSNMANYSENAITASRYNPIFEKLAKDSNIKAVVIRVNSPGGSALESEILLNEIKKLKAVKPVIISMGNVAASGGYFISSNADYIMADDYTITGSIGVVAMLPNIKNLTDKIGVTSDKIQRGKFANLLDLYSKPDPKTLKLFEKGIADTYWEFKNHVSEGRNLTMRQVQEIAQGQVWSAKTGKEISLVDSIGTINDAVAKSAEIARMSNYSVSYYPKQKTYLEYLMENKFNMNLQTKLTKTQISKDLKLDKAYELFDLVREDPIQLMMPYYIDE